jgi:hypothetical protein
MLFKGIYTPAVVGSIRSAPTNVFAGQGGRARVEMPLPADDNDDRSDKSKDDRQDVIPLSLGAPLSNTLPADASASS